MRMLFLIIFFGLIAVPNSSLATHDEQERWDKMSVEEFCSDLNPQRSFINIQESLGSYDKLIVLLTTHTPSHRLGMSKGVKS